MIVGLLLAGKVPIIVPATYVRVISSSRQSEAPLANKKQEKMVSATSLQEGNQL